MSQILFRQLTKKAIHCKRLFRPFVFTLEYNIFFLLDLTFNVGIETIEYLRVFFVFFKKKLLITIVFSNTLLLMPRSGNADTQIAIVGGDQDNQQCCPIES